MIISALPVLSVGLEAEWVHKLLVLLAIPASGLAIITSKSYKSKALVNCLLVLGLASLILGAFEERFHDYETILTVIGACALASGHLLRWKTHKH